MKEELKLPKPQDLLGAKADASRMEAESLLPQSPAGSEAAADLGEEAVKAFSVEGQGLSGAKLETNVANMQPNSGLPEAKADTLAQQAQVGGPEGPLPPAA